MSMPRSFIIAGTVIVPLLVGLAAKPAVGAVTRPTLPSPDSIVINRGVVELETGSSAGISVRIAEDLANVINDGATRRVVPVVGKGSLANLTDLKLLRGINIAILQTDTLDYAREQQLFPGIEVSIAYIAKLYNEEFHLLVRPEINSISDLANQKINVDLRDSGTAITARRLFDLLKLQVTLTNDPPDAALEKLRNGEIMGLAFVAGKPAGCAAQSRHGRGLSPGATHCSGLSKPGAAEPAGRHRLGGHSAGRRQSPTGPRPISQCGEFRRGILYWLSVPARARSPPEMARGKSRGRA